MFEQRWVDEQDAHPFPQVFLSLMLLTHSNERLIMSTAAHPRTHKKKRKKKKIAPRTFVFWIFIEYIIFSLINIAHLHFQSHLILLSTKCYECRKSGSWKVFQKRLKKEQTNKKKRAESRSNVRKDRERREPPPGKEYSWIRMHYSQNKASCRIKARLAKIHVNISRHLNCRNHLHVLCGGFHWIDWVVYLYLFMTRQW